MYINTVRIDTENPPVLLHETLHHFEMAIIWKELIKWEACAERFSHKEFYKNSFMYRLGSGSNISGRTLIRTIHNSWLGGVEVLKGGIWGSWKKKSRGFTLIKFWRYNKASLGELVPLEILGKHQQGLTADWARLAFSTSLWFLLVWARVWQNAKVERFTLLYRQNYESVVFASLSQS